MDTIVKKRIWSFVVGGTLAAAFIAFGIVNSDVLVGALVLAVVSFTFSSCLILNNTFIPEMVAEVASWGFVRMPGLIFTLDLDGIIWLLTVKLLFWILGIILAIIAFAGGIILGCIVSVFVYPYSLIKNLRRIENND